MDWSQIYLDTFIPELPEKWNSSFAAFDRNIAVFYDKDRGVLIKPLETTGRVKGAKGEFVTITVDNLIVRNQFTNLYENTTTIDSDFVTAYNGLDVSTRIASSDTSTNVIWPLEPSAYSWVDVNISYIKIDNDASYGFQNDNIGQEFRVIFADPASTSDDFKILMDSSEGGQSNLTVTVGNAPTTWIKLITTAWDASYGPTWVVKEYAGTYTIA